MENKKVIIYGGILLGIILIIIYYFFSINSDENLEEIYDIGIVNETVTQENIVNEISKIKVHITGEVNNQGIVELEEGARIDDAIKAAGNINLNADLTKVNLAYELSDGQKIYIPSLNENNEEYITSDAGENVLEDENVENGKININTADESLLQNINGVGEALASRIVDYRKKNGKFKSIDDLKNVSGIGEKKFEDIKDKIVVK